MNDAQELIDVVGEYSEKDWFRLFYPTLWALKKADKDLSKLFKVTA